MLEQQVYIINTFLMVLDAVAVVIAGYGANYFQPLGSFGPGVGSNIFTATVLLAMFVNNYVLGKLKLYSDRKPSSYARIAWSVLQSVLVCFAVLSAVMVLIDQYSHCRIFLIYFSILSFIVIFLVRSLMQLYVGKQSRRKFHARKILIVGDQEKYDFLTDLLARQLSWGHEVIGRLSTREDADSRGNVLGSLGELADVLRCKAVDEVIFALDATRSIDLSVCLDICQQMGLEVKILPALWKPGRHPLAVERYQQVPFLSLHTTNIDASSLLYKRVLDVIGGLFGTLIFLMLYPVIALAIKIDTPGPVIFKQERVSWNGRVFSLYKFRSMYVGADEQKKEFKKNNRINGAMFKLDADPRVTPVGRWLRITSIDELPQFLNVLKGEMSLVGTRPPTVDEVQAYNLKHRKRLAAKPGITGLWQISGRSKIKDFEKVVELDCQYLENWRFSDDLKILFKTAIVVLKRKGAL